MLRGEPFSHWLDYVLIGERDSCAKAVECCNDGSRTENGLSHEAKQELFAQILDSRKRLHSGKDDHRKSVQMRLWL